MKRWQHFIRKGLLAAEARRVPELSINIAAGWKIASYFLTGFWSHIQVEVHRVQVSKAK